MDSNGMNEMRGGWDTNANEDETNSKAKSNRDEMGWEDVVGWDRTKIKLNR